MALVPLREAAFTFAVAAGASKIELPQSDLGDVFLAATALVFARSLGDFGITIMLAGNIPGRTQTLSVAIYDAVEGGRGDVARVLVLVISAIALTLLYLANRLGRSQFGRAL